MNRLRIVFFLFTFLVTSCQGNDEVILGSDNINIEYSGRIGEGDGLSEFYWSGTSVKIKFYGSSVSAIMHDENGANYYDIIVDNDRLIMLRLNSNKTIYKLVDNLLEGEHTVELFKRTEFTQGTTRFYGFVLPVDSKVLPKEAEKERSIEFYGNSITCGYAVEDITGLDRPDSVYTNNYLSYSAITARYFNAKYSCISRSGIGITISWFPSIMPDIYNLLNPNDSASLWDFSTFTPDIVVINLMQNDYWLSGMPNHKMYKHYYKNKNPTPDYIINSYADFIKKIRREYPNANIICMLGNMNVTQDGSVWPSYVQQLVESFDDNKIYTLVVPYKNSPGHPDVKEQDEMASELIRFIEDKIIW